MPNRHSIGEQQRARVASATRALLLYLSLAVVIAGLVLTVPYAHADETVENSEIGNESDGLISLLGDSQDVSNDELDANRAKAMLEIDKVFLNDQEINGSVTGNVAINSNNGANNIGGAAFSNSSGFVNTIQNTGNNVLIQSATIVNVSIED